MKAATAVVTGAGGYIGQHLVRRLARDGWKVCAMMRRPPEDALPPGTTAVVADVEEGSTLREVFENADAVVHLACFPLEPSAVNPRKAFSTNVLGTFNVLQACRKAAVTRLVVSSSAQVYGHPIQTPMNERHPTVPTTPYGASKLAGESLALAFERWSSLQVAVLRIFNVFGLSVDDRPRATVEAKFTHRALSGRPVVIEGHPDDAMDFISVGDVVESLVSALETSTTGIYNIGSGKACALKDLALAAGVPAEAVRVDAEGRPPLLYEADTTRAKRDLNWQPSTDIFDYIASLRETMSRSGLLTEPMFMEK